MNNIFIFDFDGVIVNTFEMCLKITRIYAPEMSAEEYRQMFTGNIFESIKKRNKPTPTKAQFDYFAEYEKLVMDLKPIEDIESLLSRFKTKPIIVSSTTTTPIQKYLVKYNLRQYFGQILGSDIEKSKIIKLTTVIEENPNLVPIFVTDTLGDILEARKVGIASVAVTWGFHGRELLRTGKPQAIVNTVQELMSALSASI